MRLSIGGLLCCGSALADEWDEVRAAIDAAPITFGCHVLVGDSDNEALFTHQKGLYRWDSSVSIFSASKWLSGTAMLRAVREGQIGLDDFAHQHLEYWTTDPSDSRSAVTLRHLLGFTSGFSGGNSCSGKEPFADCVKTLYETVPHQYAAGSHFEYNEVHINLAGGMVTSATGKLVSALLTDNVFVPLGMVETRFLNSASPNLGAAFESTARDYSKFLRAFFIGGDFATGGAGVDTGEMERDQFPEATRSPFDGAWRYGLTNWYDCTATAQWSPQCAEADVHSSAGAMGFRPVIDRRYRYYLQIGSNSGSNPSMQLYLTIKPMIDKVIAARRRGAGAHNATNTTRPLHTHTQR
jgi:CubicO group peptidase (beta-lactamase class C family)